MLELTLAPCSRGQVYWSQTNLGGYRYIRYVMFVIRQFCPVEVEILVREADIVGPP